MLRILILATMLATSLSTAAHADDVIPGIGHLPDLPDAQEKPDPRLDYKVVFDVKTLADKPAEVSPALETIAALLNTYRFYGVPAEHLHLAAVFHGPSIVLLTDDATYKARTGYATNPNTVLLAQLRQAGVTMMVCGQSALRQKYDLAMLAKSAQINLSATVTFLNLQTRGYVKMEE